MAGWSWRIPLVQFCSSFSWRTHTCGELRKKHIGKQIVLCGWIQYKRLNKFLILRDGYGATQVCLTPHLQQEKKVEKLPLETVLKVRGRVIERPRDQYNDAMATGQIELEASDLDVLNLCTPNLPFNIHDFHQVKEPLRLQHRYLDLRNTVMQHNLRLRSALVLKMREFLCKVHGFVDVETPTLFRRAPGGAREFVVPTRFPGRYYALTQSPQQFKQLLMVGAIDRYFQIARCYRDEGTLPDRQPEFTQLDIEMSFVGARDVQKLVEDLLLNVWPKERPPIRTPFPRITYHNAMEMYGTDKPDTRYRMKIIDVTDVLRNKGVHFFDKHVSDNLTSIRALVIPRGSERIAEIRSILQSYNKSSQKQFDVPGIAEVRIQMDMQWKSLLKKMLPLAVQSDLNLRCSAEPGDLILLSCGKTKDVLKFLGKIRVDATAALQAKYGDLFDPLALNFMWIEDFPLFEENNEDRIESTHHPFTMPHLDDLPNLFKDPLNVRGQHYDLVLNGQEIGGGSIRIHDSSLQRRILKEILREDVSAMEHLLQALECGCPPHGGIALGLDRLLSIICGCNGIRDVMAFPKSADGKDLMSGAPAEISDDDKAIYHIRSD